MSGESNGGIIWPVTDSFLGNEHQEDVYAFLDTILRLYVITSLQINLIPFIIAFNAVFEYIITTKDKVKNNYVKI